MENLNIENVAGFGFLYGAEDSDDILVACIDSLYEGSPVFIWKPWGKDLDIKLPLCFWSSNKEDLLSFFKTITFLQVEKENLEKLTNMAKLKEISKLLVEEDSITGEIKNNALKK